MSDGYGHSENGAFIHRDQSTKDLDQALGTVDGVRHSQDEWDYVPHLIRKKAERSLLSNRDWSSSLTLIDAIRLPTLAALKF